MANNSGISAFSNLVPTKRSYYKSLVEFNSGTAQSSPFVMDIGQFALGTVTVSGVLPVAGQPNIGLEIADFWGNYHPLVSYSGGGYGPTTIQSATGNITQDMPPTWFNAMGSARLFMHDGTGVRVSATAAFIATVAVKS